MLDYFLHLFKSSFKISICLPWRTSGRKAGILTRDLLLHNLTPQVPWWRSTVCHSCAAVHVQPHLWCRNPLPNAAASLRTDQNSVAVTACLLSEDTRRLEWSGAKSIDIAWILCILWRAHYLQTRFARLWRERQSCGTPLAFWSNILSQTKLG